MNKLKSIRIESEAYGSLEVGEDHIFEFPRGIFGLPDIHEYALIHIEGAPYSVMHALEDQISFIILPAHVAVQDYGFHIDQATVDMLHITAADEVATYLIVNVVEDQLYVNMKAPLLLVPNHRRGCQFIIDDAKYSLRHPLVPKEAD